MVLFEYSWRKNGFAVQFAEEIHIPLRISVDDRVSVLSTRNSVPVFVKEDLKTRLAEFVRIETERFYNEANENLLKNSLQNDADIDRLANYWADVYEKNAHKTLSPSSQKAADDDQEQFREAYRSLMTSSNFGHVRKMLLKEREFAANLQKFIRARDWEVERMKRDHNSTIQSAVRELGVSRSEDEINRLALSHFENLHSIEVKYESQISFLMQEQKRQYRQLVMNLSKDAWSSSEKTDNLDFPGSISEESADSSNEKKPLSESFTIHLGAQLKTMHNLRLTAADSMDFCRLSQRKSDESERLHMSLGLYSTNMLHGLVILVDCRPMFHINLRTDFARSCEQSTELHFSSLEDQLQEIERDLIRANEYRSLNNALPELDGLSIKSDVSASKPTETFNYGDVYVTRHSNLSKVHVVFHLVASDDLKNQEINSRHSCVNGLRNIIRLCFKFGVTTINLPLLLINSVGDDLTVNWCLKRAELIFKCVKGFMMECSSLMNLVNEQFTVQFFVPPVISADLFAQLSDLLSQVFHIPSPFVIKK